jgi:DNA polymerase
MNPRAELLEIVGQLKTLLTSYPEIGLDPSIALISRSEERVKESPPSSSLSAVRPTNSSGAAPSTAGGGTQAGPRVDLPTLSGEGVSDLSVGQKPPPDLHALRAFIGNCKRCKLSQGRTHLVFGEGSPEARLVFVGEGPGAEEDAAGRPFVGEAGKLLTKIIESGMGLKREDVYICNVVKCRPPMNRDPDSEEIQTCLPFLKQQLKIIKPEVICTLGRIAAQSLLGREFKITQERGNWFSFMETPLMATFHPAYILRNFSEERRLKKLVWEDVKKMMRRLGLKVRGDE